jgi:ribulose-phosphate 3-epimerase
MAEIIPAILSKNYADLKNKISLVRGIAPIAQIDICDGAFVKSITWPFFGKNDDDTFLDNDLDQHFRRILNEQEGLPFWEDIDFELDLMVSDAVENFDIYTKLGPKRIIFHLEAVKDRENFREFLEGIDSYTRDAMEIGVAISPDTNVEEVFPLVSCTDFIQIMGISHIGMQGEEFNEEVLENIKILKEKFSEIIISVDGGVNLTSGEKLKEVGVDRLVSGSAIFSASDIIGKIEEFREL